MSLSGKTIVFTGTLSQTRDEASAKAKKAGAAIAGSLTKSCNLVVAGESAGKKLDEARKKNIEIITEEEFLRRLSPGGARGDKVAKRGRGGALEDDSGDDSSSSEDDAVSSEEEEDDEEAKEVTDRNKKKKHRVDDSSSSSSSSNVDEEDCWSDDDDHNGRVGQAVKAFKASRPDLFIPVVFYTVAEEGISIAQNDKTKNRTSSFFGGVPWWPAGAKFDHDLLGTMPLFFQLNFAELPRNHQVPGLPKDGLLQLFTFGYETASESEGPSSTSFQFKYWPASKLRENSKKPPLPAAGLPPPTGAEDAFGFDNSKVYPVTFSLPGGPKPGTMFITTSDYRFDSALEKFLAEDCKQLEDGDDAEDLGDEMRDCMTDSHGGETGCLGGSSRFFNGDPRESQPAENADRTLITFESVGPIMMGDCGTGTIFIAQKELDDLDFSNTTWNHDE